MLVRGPNVTPGYWGLPEATRSAIDAEGWFHTGDAAYFDKEGLLTISDRIKDMIISGGENVYPAEVESALMRHPAIAEVAVIGEPDPKWGETIVAIAALKAGQALTLEELRAFAGRIHSRATSCPPPGDDRGAATQRNRKDIEVSTAQHV